MGAVASDWHAWASQMPAALARSAAVTGDRAARRAAARDSFTFDPWLLTSGGPDNGRLPDPASTAPRSPTASTRACSRCRDRRRGPTRSPGSWRRGSSGPTPPAHRYDPATGVTFDGVAADGTVNQNSGAESTIHGLLTMLALDAHPDVRRIAQTATVQDQVGVDLPRRPRTPSSSGGATRREADVDVDR